MVEHLGEPGSVAQQSHAAVEVKVRRRIGWVARGLEEEPLATYFDAERDVARGLRIDIEARENLPVLFEVFRWLNVDRTREHSS